MNSYIIPLYIEFLIGGWLVCGDNTRRLVTLKISKKFKTMHVEIEKI